MVYDYNFDLYKFYSYIKERRVLFSYCGPITQEIIEGIGVTLKTDLKIKDASFNVSQTIFSVFIEQMQNVLNYSADKNLDDEELEKSLSIGILVISQDDKYFYIYCGNKIYSSDCNKLRTRIEQIVNLDKEQLKILYKEKRKQPAENGSKGAGLGLIEMARKSNKPLEYHFSKIDDNFCFFSIKISISKEGKTNG